MLNKVILVANLTKDPEVRYTTNGTAVTTLNVACNRKFKSGDELKEETLFVNVVVWGKRAENIREYLHKGSPIFIEGHLKSRSWEKADGTKASVVEIVSDYIQFLDRAKEGTSPEEAE